ncbi:MAG: hypothetical protein GC154_10265 [bacterium]|nr:hypothetical protein [bacterium]
MSTSINRRRFIGTASAAAVGASLEERVLLAQAAAPSTPQKTSYSSLPLGEIKGVKISRLICGGNLLAGYAHSRDLIYVSSLLRNYFQRDKIVDLMRRCETNGINTIVTNVCSREIDQEILKVIAEYRKQGGEIQFIAQCQPEDDLDALLDQSVELGAVGAFLQGGVADRAIKEKKIDRIGAALDAMKRRGLIAGVAGHSLQVPMTCERENAGADFYVKTFHHDRYWSATPEENREDLIVDVKSYEDHDKNHDNIWCIDPEETAEFMRGVKKPWVAYKVMAAGAIHPSSAFRYAYEGGADFILAGMFDFQVDEDAGVARALLSEKLDRKREWMA